jgi:MoaA/NifB/PqqE/SkfB family radical SAM enzyme
MRFNPGLKLARHRELVDYLDGKQIMPINVEISPSGRCQASCPECFYSGNQSGKILDTKTLLDQMEHMRTITWTGGGEPTLHPDFFELTSFANRLGINQGLFTNGLKFPMTSYMDWVRVSKTNKPWNTAVLKYFRDKTPTLGMCINYSGDVGGVREALEIAENVGASYVQVRPALNRGNVPTEISPPDISHPLLQITGYKFKEASQPRGYDKCEGYHFVPFIWENGEVHACAYRDTKLGSIYERPFPEIMKSAPAFFEVTDQCQTCCKNHEINKTISQLRKLEDVEFV